MSKRKLKRIKEKKIKFNLVLFSLLFLILIIFLITLFYIHPYPKENVNKFDSEIDNKNKFFGSECKEHKDCPQPRCPDVRGYCKNGFCIFKKINSGKYKCIDLKTPICGNNICEGKEKENLCPKDCLN